MNLSQIKTLLSNADLGNEDIYFKQSGDNLTLATAKKGMFSSWSINVFSDWIQKLNLYWNGYTQASSPEHTAELVNTIFNQILSDKEQSVPDQDKEDFINTLRMFTAQLGRNDSVETIFSHLIKRFNTPVAKTPEPAEAKQAEAKQDPEAAQDPVPAAVAPKVLEQEPVAANLEKVAQGPTPAEVAELQEFFETTFSEVLGLRYHMPKEKVKQFIETNPSKEDLIAWGNKQIKEYQDAENKELREAIPRGTTSQRRNSADYKLQDISQFFREQKNDNKAPLERYFYTKHYNTLSAHSIPLSEMQQYIKKTDVLSEQGIDSWVETTINAAHAAAKKTDRQHAEQNASTWKTLRNEILQNPEFASLLEEQWDLTKAEKKHLFQYEQGFKRKAYELANTRKEQKEFESRFPKSNVKPEQPAELSSQADSFQEAGTVITELAHDVQRGLGEMTSTVVENATIAKDSIVMAADHVTKAADHVGKMADDALDHMVMAATDGFVAITSKINTEQMTTMASNAWGGLRSMFQANTPAKPTPPAKSAQKTAEPETSSMEMTSLPGTNEWEEATLATEALPTPKGKKKKKDASTPIDDGAVEPTPVSMDLFKSSVEETQLNTTRWDETRADLLKKYEKLPKEWDLSEAAKKRLSFAPNDQFASMANEIAANCNRLHRYNNIAKQLRLDNLYDPAMGETKPILAEEFVALLLDRLSKRPSTGIPVATYQKMVNSIISAEVKEPAQKQTLLERAKRELI